MDILTATNQFIPDVETASLILAEPSNLEPENARSRRRLLERFWYTVRTRCNTTTSNAATATLKRVAHRMVHGEPKMVESCHKSCHVSSAALESSVGNDTYYLIPRSKKPSREDFVGNGNLGENPEPESRQKPPFEQRAFDQAKAAWQADPREQFIAGQADKIIRYFEERIKLLHIGSRRRARAYVRQLLRCGEMTIDEARLAIRNLERMSQGTCAEWRTNACDLFAHRENLLPYLADKDWIFTGTQQNKSKDAAIRLPEEKLEVVAEPIVTEVKQPIQEEPKVEQKPFVPMDKRLRCMSPAKAKAYLAQLEQEAREAEKPAEQKRTYQPGPHQALVAPTTVPTPPCVEPLPPQPKRYKTEAERMTALLAQLQVMSDKIGMLHDTKPFLEKSGALRREFATLVKNHLGKTTCPEVEAMRASWPVYQKPR